MEKPTKSSKKIVSHAVNGEKPPPSLRLLKLDPVEQRALPYESPPTTAQLRDDLHSGRAILSIVVPAHDIADTGKPADSNDASGRLRTSLRKCTETEAAALWLEVLCADQDELWTGLGDDKVWVLACPDVWDRWRRERPDTDPINGH